MGWSPGGNSKGWFVGKGLNGGGGKNGEWWKWGKEAIFARGSWNRDSRGGVSALSTGRDVMRAFSSDFGEDPLRCESGDPEHGLL